MYNSVIARRADDAVISVQQDNVKRSLTIVDVNTPALSLLQYENKNALCGNSLFSILDTKTKQAIQSNVEFEDEGTDLSDVVSKIREFSLLNSKLEAMPIRPKIFRVASSRGTLNYELLLLSTSISQKLDAFRKTKLPEFHKYIVDQSFGVLDRQSLLTEVGIVLDFVNDRNMEATIGVAALDKHIPQDSKVLENANHVLVNTIVKSIRYTDIVGHMGDNRFVFMLLGCKSTDAYSAVSRILAEVLRSLAREAPGYTASIGYFQMRSVSDCVQLLKGIQRGLDAVQLNGGSSVSLGEL